MKLIDYLSVGIKLRDVYARFCRPVCEKHGLSQTEFDVLMFLANNPEHNTARDVCERRQIKKALASVSVERLTRAGYLERAGDARDRRVKRLQITPGARALIREGREAQGAFAAALSGEMTAEELALLRALNEKLARAVERLAGEEND